MPKIYATVICTIQVTVELPDVGCDPTCRILEDAIEESDVRKALREGGGVLLDNGRVRVDDWRRE
jgi:hypothetical protein